MFRAQTFLNPVGAVSSPCALRRQCSERKVVFVYMPHSNTAHLKHSVFWRLQNTYTFQVMSPSTRTHPMHRTDLLMRSGQATPTPQGGNVSRRTMNEHMMEKFNKSKLHNTWNTRRRIQLQTEELMMTFLKASFQENSEKREASCYQLTTVIDFSSK